MFCPQCGVESPSGLQYCRSCGANLKVIGKALTLSEAIARSDRGPLPKIKEMVKNLKVEQVTEEVARALDRMNNEIVSHSHKRHEGTPWWRKHKKTAQERREEHITKGIVSMFSGAGLMIFLYYFTAALVLKLPPHIIAQIPLEIDPVVHVLWLIGMVPLLAGAGNIVAGLFIRGGKAESIQSLDGPEKIREIAGGSTSSVKWVESLDGPASVTERTTNLLGQRGANGSKVEN